MDFPLIGTIVLNVILVILGINALIIVHEFGHFIVARLCGVRCEKFYIWFDFWGLKFFKFKWGDTEYGLGVFPLGGYVKMLGQEDNPGELRAEMERAKKGDGDVKSPNGDEAPTHTVEELNEAIYSPDSYLAKSVPQRLAIICAGVTMNFLFAIVCGAAAYMVGVEEVAPVVGGMVPGAPAWMSDLQVGDRIVSVAGNPTRSFMDLNMAMVGAEDGVQVMIERPGKNGGPVEQIEKTIKAQKRPGDLSPRLGITSFPTLKVVHPEVAVKDWSPVREWTKKYYAEETLAVLNRKNLRLESVDGTPVASFAEFQEAQLKYYGKPLAAQFGDGENKVEATLPAIPKREIGVRFAPGRIVAVLPGSDAEAKGVKVGDMFIGVDGDRNFDPIKLPQTILQKLNEGQKTVELEVVGSDPDKGQEKMEAAARTVSIELKPERILPELNSMSMKDSPGSTALGLVWEVQPIVAGISPHVTDVEKVAEEIPVGSKVVSVKFVNADRLLANTSFCKMEKDGFLCMNVGEKIDIPYIYTILLQAAEPKPLTEKEKNANVLEKDVLVRLEIVQPDGTKKSVDLPIFESTDWFHADRSVKFGTEMAMVKVDDLGQAMQLGTAKMLEYSMAVFKFLERLASGGISPRAMGGPIMIVQAAWMFVEKGMGSYLLFLCLIGANLAVINILPIPVLDGGHVVFLLYEGIFRKPPNENIQIVLSYLGLALILTLMVWVVALDIGCISRF